MPKKLSFTDHELDLQFLYRFTQRVRQRDKSLGFDSLTLSKIEMVFPHEVFQGKYSTVIELANDNLLGVLNAEQRRKLSKARYAFQQKRKSRQIKLDATIPTSINLQKLVKVFKEDLKADDSLEKSLITQKRVLEASLETFCQLIQSYTLPEEYRGFDKYVQNEFIKNLKESDSP